MQRRRLLDGLGLISDFIPFQVSTPSRNPARARASIGPRKIWYHLAKLALRALNFIISIVAHMVLEMWTDLFHCPILL